MPKTKMKMDSPKNSKKIESNIFKHLLKETQNNNPSQELS